MSHKSVIYVCGGGQGAKILVLNSMSLIGVKIGLPLAFHFKGLKTDRSEDEVETA